MLGKPEIIEMNKVLLLARSLCEVSSSTGPVACIHIGACEKCVLNIDYDSQCLVHRKEAEEFILEVLGV